MTWFENLTGFPETSAEEVRKQLYMDGSVLHSRANACSWQCGDLEIPSLSELRNRARVNHSAAPTQVREVVADVQHLHAEPKNEGALFQVASQFNLLEMMAPDVTPERGVGIYERDPTQGPACAVAAGAATIFRNYFVEVHGRIGQTADKQIDCLADLGGVLGNHEQRLWQMVNGYALPSEAALIAISERIGAMSETDKDRLRQALRIGVQWNTQVTLGGAGHLVSQAFCSALPILYTNHSMNHWKPFARLILEATYEATICAAMINAANTGNNAVFLTLVGGGAFGNDLEWILSALGRSLQLYPTSGLDVAIVSHMNSKPLVRELAERFCSDR